MRVSPYAMNSKKRVRNKKNQEQIIDECTGTRQVCIMITKKKKLVQKPFTRRTNVINNNKKTIGIVKRNNSRYRYH